MFFEKAECLTSTYKSGSLRDKLPKKNNVHIREFISYLNQLLHILTKIIIIIIIIINIYILLILF